MNMKPKFYSNIGDCRQSQAPDPFKVLSSYPQVCWWSLIQIQTAKRLFIMFCIWLGLAACTGHQAISPHVTVDGRSPLNDWLENTLIPYLLQQFEQHPRFRGQPIRLVRMQGENIMPRIDELTEQIRQKITDAMIDRSGLNLVWRPTNQPWKHHQRIAEVSCGETHKAHYYVGIDVGLTKMSRLLYVKVRALNSTEQKWVSGFGKTWQGKPTDAQLAALAREHPDKYLRGLRPLPFSDQQPDLLADYLSRNLICLLRQSAADELVVHVAPPKAGTPDTLRTSLELVGRYLARFRDVEVSDNPNQANITLVSTIHPIDQQLHQVWISARQRQGQKYLPGAGTKAYVLIEAGHNNHGDVGKSRPSFEPETRLPRHPRGSAIISDYDLITPLNQAFCATNRPWRSGVQRLDIHQTIPTGTCLAVEMEIKTPAYVFVVAQDARGELSRIFPSDCPNPGRQDAMLRPGEIFQYPSLSDPHAGVLQLGGWPGTERIYAIAITTPELADIFNARLQGVQGLCRSGDKYPPMLQTDALRHPRQHIQRWQEFLNWLSSNNPGRMEWREIQFRHVEL